MTVNPVAALPFSANSATGHKGGSPRGFMSSSSRSHASGSGRALSHPTPSVSANYLNPANASEMYRDILDKILLSGVEYLLIRWRDPSNSNLGSPIAPSIHPSLSPIELFAEKMREKEKERKRENERETLRRVTLSLLNWNLWKTVDCGWDRIKSEMESLSADLAGSHVIVKAGDVVAVNTKCIPMDIR